MNWEEHVQMLKYTDDFEGTYRMSIEALYTLLDAIREDLTLSFAKSVCSTSGNKPIYPELILAMGLRFDPIQICLPVGDNMVRYLAERYQAVSTAHGLFDGHLGALDGWLPGT
eukprot:9662128-Ditylum_brightwellii.AAC.1